MGPRNEPAGWLADISTHWSALKGPPRSALDYLYRVYGRAILAYIRGRLARGDFGPLAPDDAEDLLQDLFLRLGSTEWLKKPDRSRGRFRGYLVGRVDFFLRERRSAAAGKRHNVRAESLPELASPDRLQEELEREWRLATVHEALDRVRQQNQDWYVVLRADLERDEEQDAEIAARLGKSLESFRSLLKRARAAFREVYPVVDARLDGFGGEEF